jgi:hypothetical protein
MRVTGDVYAFQSSFQSHCLLILTAESNFQREFHPYIHWSGLNIVAHLSPAHELHLDLTSGRYFFVSTSLESRLTAMVYKLLILKLVRYNVDYRLDGKLLQGDLKNRQVL